MKTRASVLLRSFFLLVVFLFLAAFSSYASWVSLSSGSYGANTSVTAELGQISAITGCPAGGIDDFIYGYADVYVVPAGSTGMSDVSNPAGIPNTLFYVVIDEVIANTGPGGYLISGDYAVLIDDCQDGLFNGTDSYGPEFQVRIPANVDPLQSAAFAAQLDAMKTSADSSGEHWIQAAAHYRALFDAYNAITLYSIATDPADFLLFACTNINLDTGQLYCSLTDAWGGLMKLQNGVIGMLVNQAFYYKGIAADPPDSNFKELPFLDQGYSVDLNVTPDVLQAALKYGELAGQEQALAQAVLQAMERYQGAEQAGFGEYAYVQAREIEKHSRTLADLVLLTSTAFQDLITQVNATGVDFVSIMDDYRATQARVQSSGITSAERAKLISEGWNDAQIAEGLADYVSRDFSGLQNSNDLTLIASQISAAAAAMSSALIDFADVMATAQADLAAQLRIPFPQADAGGKYDVNEGDPITLAGSAVLPDAATPAYAWDLDLDGEFDDATGPSPTVSFNQEYQGFIGLKVTLPNGYYDISYTDLRVLNANSSPAITSQTPSGPVTIAFDGTAIFSVTASDPDSDPLTYSWEMDGASVASGTSSYTFNATLADVGEHVVTVRVSDGSPLSLDTSYMWRLTVTGIDGDGDGFPSNVDCNDGDPDVNPGAGEIYYDGVDNDCNPTTPDDPDGDDDGFDYTVDCNDGDPAINPSATEVCNGADDNCDGQIDEGVLSSFYPDGDSDTYGSTSGEVQECVAPAGYVSNSSDCNDGDPGINPAATEVCNGTDDNCDGQVDEGLLTTYFWDGDGDSYGNPAGALDLCTQQAGMVTNADDCNDSDAAINPAATEILYDGIDNDCNPATLDGLDDDNDGYQDTIDCDDNDPAVNPGRTEIIHNGKDDDCNAATLDNWSQSFIIASDDNSYLYYAKSNGDGTFSDYKRLFQYSSSTGRGVVIEDFNGDGGLDVMAGSSNGSMYLFVNDGSDNFTNMGVVANHSYGSYIIGMGAGDFNNDGLTDFVANGNSTPINVFINDGYGGFNRTVITGSGTGRGLDVADFDADGNLDFIRSATGNNDVWLYEGNGDGTFTASNVGTATGSNNDNYAMAAADFDNDGAVDIIVGGSNNGNPYFFQGNGDGTFQSPVHVPSLDTGYYNAIDAYDLNNDGNADIVQSTYNSRQIRYYPGVGDGTFGAAVTISTSNTTYYVLAIAAPPMGNPADYPVASVEPKTQTINLGESANFDGSFSFDPDGSLTGYDWLFGDGNSGTGVTASHEYLAEGHFGASLIVTDNDGKKDADSARVTVVGAPPVANAGGPYSFGESFATQGIYSVTVDGSGSTDDFGIISYKWEFPSLFADTFDGTVLSSDWIASDGVSQDGSATIVGTGSWGTRYLFTQRNFVRQPELTFEFRVTPSSASETQYGMFGIKNTGTNYSYTQLVHAFYFNQGNILIYEGGSNRGTVSSYTRGTQYDLKLVLRSTGAFYYMRPTGAVDWQLIYTSGYSNLASLKFGATISRGTFSIDDVNVSHTLYGASPNVSLGLGNYPVTLTVTDLVGQQNSQTTNIQTTAGAPPVAAPGGPYVADEASANQGKWTIDFDASLSSDDVEIESYVWDFGDGGAGTGVAPSHLYAAEGTYTVSLTVFDGALQSNTVTTTVTTQGNEFPMADPGGPYNINEDEVVNKHWSVAVDAAGSTDDYGIWTYSWNFGDGSGAVTTAQATHEYATPGTYTITLTVTDHANQSHNATTTASVVATAAPTASAGGPYASEPNTPVQFDGSGSFDNTGIVSYEWDFGDGTTGKGEKPTHAYTDPGVYSVSLTVTDTALQTATAGTTVNVTVGNPPVADAGGPYTGHEGVPVRLNGSGSTDDYGIVSYEWSIGASTTVLTDDFTGTAIDTDKWLFPTSGVTQDEVLTITGGTGWGSRYLFTKENYTPTSTVVLTGQFNQTVGGHLMFGFKDTSTSYNYPAMPYALYINNGSFNIYESGNHRGAVGNYSFNVLYDVRVEMVFSGGTAAGARYYYKNATSGEWILLYDSSYATTTTSFKAGMTFYSGTYQFDNISLVSGVSYAVGASPVLIPPFPGELPVQLTVTDGAGQTSTAATTLSVGSGPLAITVPWQFSGGIEVPHDTWSGEEVILKAVAKAGKSPLTYSWDFGDGSSTTPVEVTDPYNISAKHTYIAADGTPFVARVTVTDADGLTSTDTYPIIVREKTLDVEINKAIDDALWYVHTKQNRSNGRWLQSETSGYAASPTASSIHAMQINGHLEVGDFLNDPYVEDVWRGMEYIMKSLRQKSIADQAYGDPDVNGNGIGLETIESQPIYQGGQLMMAIVASGTPDMRAQVGGAGIMGRTYREIVEDMAEMYYWGQGDAVSGYAAGGWRYGWQNQADNSACQWAALGFEAAEEQGWIEVPQWVKDRNVVWLAYSNRSDGIGYGYAGAGHGVATSPSGLAQVAFDGIQTNDDRWKKTENDLARLWDSWYNTTGNYYALYAVAKAMRIAKPAEIVVMGEGTPYAIDWYNDNSRGMARTIVNQQDANGKFVGGGGSKWVEGSFRTAWGVIILTKTLFVLPPVADAGENQVWGVDWPLTLDGSNSFHLDPFRNIVLYEWDLDGDGTYDTSSDQPTVIHTYADLGTYSVSLRVTDNNDPAKSDTDTVTIIVAVPPHPPVADPDGPYVGYVGVPMQLDGSGSYDIDPTDIITSYEWEVDGVFPYGFDDASGATPTVTWDSPGSYNVGLRVFDNGVLSPGNEKLSDIGWTTITIQENNPPVADADGPYTVSEGSTINLDASGSSDPDGNPLSYAWDLDNDGTFETPGVSPAFAGIDDNVFTVELQVTDGGLFDTDTTTVTVENVAPQVDAGPGDTINEGSTFSSAGSFTDPGADSWTATVDYGDGSGVQPLTLNPDKSFVLNHFYGQDGVYTVTVTVTDDDGGVGSSSAEVTVNNVAPTVDAGPDATLVATRNFVSDGSFTDPGADVWTATVDYGDGSGAQPLALNPDKTFDLNHIYSRNGTFTVTVTVNDEDGGTGTDTAVVTIDNRAPQVDAGPDDTIDEGGTFISGGSFTDPGSDSWTATVDYGDGSGVQPLALNPDGTFDLIHTYTDNGVYDVTVTVTDNDGGVGVDTAVVTVNNVPPLVDAGPDGTINQGDTFVSNGSFTDPGDDSWTATVDYGDGAGPQPLALNPDKTFGLSHAYSNAGVFTVTVTVTDDDGGTGTDTAAVTVESSGVEPEQTIFDLRVLAKTDKADLIWTCVPGEVTYNVYRGTSAGGPYGLVASGHTSSYCTYADFGLTTGTTYYWVVTSVEDGVESLHSNETSATPSEVIIRRR